MAEKHVGTRSDDAAASRVRRAAAWLTGVVVCVAASLAFVGAKGCDEARTALPYTDGGKVEAVIGRKKFQLEPAFDQPTRELGLGKRTAIDPSGGMFFVFPSAMTLDFVMRDCPVPIDVAFLDDSGRILTMYAMEAEAPRRPDETPIEYELRLKRYSSRYRSRYVVEVAGGTFAALGVKEGDVVRFDAQPLKARAR